MLRQRKAGHERAGVGFAGRAMPLAAAATLALVLVVVLAIGSTHVRDGADRVERARVADQLVPYATALASAVDRPMAMLEGLHDFVVLDLPEGPSRERFETFAAGLTTNATGVRAVQLAPDGIVTFVYPLEGNVTGNNLLADDRPEVRADIERTLASEDVVVSGPYELRQGGLGLVGRQAVRRPDGTLWGFAVIVLDVPPLLEAAGLAEDPQGLRVAIRDQSMRVFAGEADVFDEAPVLMKSAHADGVWELAAVPAQGWYEASSRGQLIFWSLGLVAATAMSVTLYLVLTQQRRLRAEVALQTEMLRSQTALLERVAETTPVGIVLVSTGGAVMFANDAAEQILGLSRSDIASRTYDDPEWRIEGVNGEELSRDELPVGRVLATGEPVSDGRITVERPDGNRRVLSINAGPLLDGAGEMRGVVASLLDITESVEAEAALRRSERLLHSTLDDMIEGCQIVGLDWTYLYVNRAAELHDRRPKHEILGKRMHDVWPGLDGTALYEVFRACLEDRVNGCIETEFTFPDGVTRWFDVSVQTVPEGMLVLSMDVTSRREQQREIDAYRNRLENLVQARTAELSEALQELEESNRKLTEATAAKSRFLARVSHELRTPLNSIIGFSHLMSAGLAGDLTPEQARHVAIIGQSGQHLLALINDVLDLSKVEAGAVEVRWETVRPTDALLEIADTIRPLAEGRGLELRVAAECNGLLVRTDRGKLKQILLNLAGNAVKFTDAGFVELRLDCRRAGSVGFVVADSGRGIHPEDLQRLFEPFTQLDTPDRLAQGTGLGLTISREYASMLGGEIHVASAVGEGSAFTLWLPVEE